MALYLLGPENLVALVTTWGIGAVLTMLGTATCGRSAAVEYRIGAGWGVLAVILTLWGVFIPASLRIPAAAVAVLGLAAQAVPSRRVLPEDWRTLGRLLLVTLPLWLVMAPVRPSQIDTFLNLLPNADYLVDYGRLPTAGSPPIQSWYPGAPYDTQFLAFLGALLDPDYPAPGMSLVNIMLQLVAGLAMARVLAREPGRLSWGMLALGMLLATLLNPGFVPRFHFSSYGETGLAVTALLAASLLVEAPPARRASHALRRLEPALILAAMINTKQSGIGLVLALAGAAVLAGWAENIGRWAEKLRETVPVLVPAAALYGVWRYFVAHAGVAELAPLPFAEWNWPMLPAMMRNIAGAIAGKPLYFAAEAIAVFCLPLLLRRQGWTVASRFLALNAAVFLLYNGFLVVTYIAHFSPLMSEEAHSYFRYNTHLSLILVLALALAVRELAPRPWAEPRVRRAAASVAVALALAAPPVFAERLRFDIEMPQPLVWDLAAELKPYLKDGDRLALLLPGDDGEIGQMLTGYLASAPPRRRNLAVDEYRTADAASLAAAAAAGDRLAVVSCTADGFLGLPARMAGLLRREDDGWRPVASWRHAAGIALSHWQHTRHWPALCR